MSKTVRPSSSVKCSGRGRARVSIVPKAEGWAVQKTGAVRATRIYDTQREALNAAKKMIKREAGGEVLVHGRNGRIRSVDTYALGMSGFSAISAVEGISLTKEMRRDFRTLDRKKLSPDARIRWLIEKYGK